MNSIINSCMKFSRYIRVSETISCIFYTSGLIDHAIQESLFLDRIIDKRLISLLKIRQPPIFPGRLQPSIVGRSELNFRVRDGNGWTLALISTNSMSSGLAGEQTVLYCISLPLSRTFALEKSGDPYRIRTDVKGVRGLCLNHLTNGPFWYTFRDSNPGHPD